MGGYVGFWKAVADSSSSFRSHLEEALGPRWTSLIGAKLTFKLSSLLNQLRSGSCVVGGWAPCSTLIKYKLLLLWDLMHALIEASVVSKCWSVDWLNQNNLEHLVKYSQASPQTNWIGIPGWRLRCLYLNELFRSFRCTGRFGNHCCCGKSTGSLNIC